MGLAVRRAIGVVPDRELAPKLRRRAGAPYLLGSVGRPPILNRR
jgi:hypothetical protein